MGMGSDEKQEQTEGDEDVISKTIGDFGRWQLTFTFLLSLFNLPCTWHIYSLTFQAPDVDFWCQPPDNLRQLPVNVWRNLSHIPVNSTKRMDNPCEIWDIDYTQYTADSILGHNFGEEGAGRRECTAWTYQQDNEDETLISQWDLVCSRAPLVSTAGTAFLAGVAFGGLISGFLSDRFGRKKVLMASTLGQVLLGTVITFVPWLQLYLVLKFFLGLISVSIVFTGFVLCMELVGGKWRTISGVCYIFPVALGYISSAGISFVLKDWKYNQLAITLPGLLLLALYWVLPESPRWLLTMGKVEENVAIIKEACQINRRPIPTNLDKILQQNDCTVDAAEPSEKVGLLDLFRYPTIRKKSLVLFVIWFGVYFVYYGLVMNMSSFGGDIYANTIISGAVEIPSLAVSIVILLNLGRRWPMSLTMLGSGIVCLISSFFSEAEPEITFGLAMTARSMIACSNMILPVYTAELFPTVVRNLGVGASNVSGGAAMVLVPFLWQLAQIAYGLPMGALGACGVVGGLVALTLPETASQPMINTIEEGEEWGRRSKALKASSKAPDVTSGNFNKTSGE